MGTYVKGVTKEALRQAFIANGILHRSSDLIEVKEPHGRLIDADRLHEAMQEGIEYEAYDKPFDYIAEVLEAPTVIDAEGKR